MSARERGGIAVGHAPTPDGRAALFRKLTLFTPSIQSGATECYAMPDAVNKVLEAAEAGAAALTALVQDGGDVDVKDEVSASTGCRVPTHFGDRSPMPRESRRHRLAGCSAELSA